MGVIRTREELIQLYKEGLIGPNTIRNMDIRDKIAGMPGKLSNRVRRLAEAHNLSPRTIYRIITASTL